MSDWLTVNRAIAAFLAPQAATALDRAARDDGFSVVPSRTGAEVLEWEGRALDSRRDPRAAARMAADEIAQSPVVVIGLGTGYYVEALLQRGVEVAGIVDTGAAILAGLAARDLRAVLARVPLVVIDAPDGGVAVSQLRARANGVAPHAPRVQMHEGLARLAQAWAAIAPARPPRIVVAGPPSGGSLGVAHSVASSAETLGADVRFVDCGVFGAAHEELGTLPVGPAQQKALQGHFALLLGEAIVEVAREWSADLVLALAQAPLSGPTLTRLRALGIPTAFWFVENTRVLPYWRDVAEHYDTFFTIQSGPVQEQIAAAGARCVKYLPMACDPDVHFPVTLDEADAQRFAAPVSFAGAPYLNRRHVLGAVRDLGLRVWGDGWETTALAPCVGAEGRFDPDTQRKIVAATAVNVNLHSAEHVTGLDPMPDYVNPRTFEIAACGGFQLVDRRDPLPELFADDELATFESAAHLRERAAYYLKHRDVAAGIATRARARVLASHTYAHRVRELLAAALPGHLQPVSARAGARSIAAAIEEAGARPVLDAEETLLRLVAAVGKEAAAR
jgi:spore maturation protein CgeB